VRDAGADGRQRQPRQPVESWWRSSQPRSPNVLAMLGDSDHCVRSVASRAGTGDGGLNRSRDHLMIVIAGSLLALALVMVMVRRSDAMTAASARITIHA
jgi:hypothetical protein